jgi:hypothetical protein
MPVLISFKYILAAVTAIHDMMARSRIPDSQWSCHGGLEIDQPHSVHYKDPTPFLTRSDVDVNGTILILNQIVLNLGLGIGKLWNRAFKL